MPYTSIFTRKLEERKYWIPTKNEYHNIFTKLEKNYGPKNSAKNILDQLSTIMENSRQGVSAIQQERLRNGLIENTSQSTMSVAGKNYEALVGYSLEINRILKNIPSYLKISLVTKNSKIIQNYATIRIGIETQKPDVDIAIYSVKPDSPIIICSTKTSLRERAGQSYKWKLLLDISRCKCEHEKGCPLAKYDIEYPSQKEIYVFFITADFYGEIHQPQQRGMLTFFDGSYVSKNVQNTDYIKKLSSIVDDINSIYK